MAAQRGIGLILLVVIAGLVVGSFLGELLGSLLPAGRAQDLIMRGPTIDSPTGKPSTLAPGMLICGTPVSPPCAHNPRMRLRTGSSAERG